MLSKRNESFKILMPIYLDVTNVKYYVFQDIYYNLKKN